MIQLSVSEIQSIIQAQVANPEFASALLTSLQVKGMTSLKDAGPDDLTFFFSKNYQQDFFQTQSRVIVTGKAFVKLIEAANPPAWKNAVILACDDPYLSMAVISGTFSRKLSAHDHQEMNSVPSTIHPTAVVAADVKLGTGIEIGAYAVIESGSEIADGVVIYPHCYVGKDCKIGRQSVLFPKVTLYQNTMIGQHCRLHAGVVIGGDGFGYAPIKDAATGKAMDHQKIYHLGNVVIGDHVEIGANTSIDRGTFGSTVVQSKAKIDNQVQIGHNCNIGEGSILCGGVAMAGSSSLGKFVIMLGQSATDNQVHLGDYTIVSPYSGVTKDTEPGAHVMGMPSRPFDDQIKIMAIQNKLLRERNKGKKQS